MRKKIKDDNLSPCPKINISTQNVTFCWRLWDKEKHYQSCSLARHLMMMIMTVMVTEWRVCRGGIGKDILLNVRCILYQICLFCHPYIRYNTLQFQRIYLINTSISLTSVGTDLFHKSVLLFCFSALGRVYKCQGDIYFGTSPAWPKRQPWDDSGL